MARSEHVEDDGEDSRIGVNEVVALLGDRRSSHGARAEHLGDAAARD